jgi:hypothetical protein
MVRFEVRVDKAAGATVEVVMDGPQGTHDPVAVIERSYSLDTMRPLEDDFQ